MEESEFRRAAAGGGGSVSLLSEQLANRIEAFIAAAEIGNVEELEILRRGISRA